MFTDDSWVTVSRSAAQWAVRDGLVTHGPFPRRPGPRNTLLLQRCRETEVWDAVKGVATVAMVGSVQEEKQIALGEGAETGKGLG